MAKRQVQRNGAARRRSSAPARAASRASSPAAKGASHSPRTPGKGEGEKGSARQPSRGQTTTRKAPVKAKPEAEPVRRPAPKPMAKTGTTPKPVPVKPVKQDLTKVAAPGAKPDTMAARVEEIKALVALGKKKGYLTYDEIMSHLPEDETSAERFDEIFRALGEMDIEVVDAPERAKGTEGGRRRERKRRRRWSWI